jgi:hypothetical protein
MAVIGHLRLLLPQHWRGLVGWPEPSLSNLASNRRHNAKMTDYKVLRIGEEVGVAVINVVPKKMIR